MKKTRFTETQTWHLVISEKEQIERIIQKYLTLYLMSKIDF
jgi:hypothetical protein